MQQLGSGSVESKWVAVCDLGHLEEGNEEDAIEDMVQERWNRKGEDKEAGPWQTQAKEVALGDSTRIWRSLL